MIIGTLEVKLHAPYVHSLKEKRMIVRSILARIRNKFNVSACEVDEQDLHQIIVIGVAAVANNIRDCDHLLDTLIEFIQCNEEAQVVDVFREIL